MPRAHQGRSSAVSSLGDHLGYWLRFVSNHVSLSFRTRLARRNVTFAEWVVLRALYAHDGVAPSQLANELAMTRGTISKIVERLCVRKLVDRTQGDGDRRYQKLELTGSGRSLVPKLASLADENDTEFFGHLQAGERAHIEQVLKDIVARLKLRTIPVD